MAQVALDVVVPLVVLVVAWTAHELAHWAVLALVGYPPVRVHLGPFEGTRVGAGMRWRNAGLAWIRLGVLGGVVGDQERRSPAGVRMRSALWTAAGPAAQLTIGALAAVVAAAGGGLPFWIAAGVVGAAALVELVPVSIRLSGDFAVWNDGMWLWRWLTAPAATSTRTACIALSTALRRVRRRPRDVRDEWVALALAAEPTTGELVTGRLFVLQQAIDRGETDRARFLAHSAYAGRALPDTPSTRLEIAAWAAYVAARHDGDAAEACRILRGEEGWSGTDFVHGLAVAAVCLAAGRLDEALTTCDWLLIAPWLADDGVGAMLREQVESLRTEAAEGAEPAGAVDVMSAEPGCPGRAWELVPAAAIGAAIETLRSRAQDQAAAGRVQEAAATWAELARRFADAPEPEQRASAASALVSAVRGLVAETFRLGRVGRPEEAIVLCDQVESRFGDAHDPAVRVHLASALVSKSFRLGELARREEAIAVCDQVESRFGDAVEPDIRERVAMALFNKAFRLGQLDRLEEAIAVCDQVETRSGDEPAARGPVVRSLALKAAKLGVLGRVEEAIVVCDQVQERFGDAVEPEVRERVATMLVDKGYWLGEQGWWEESIVLYDQVEARFGDEPAAGAPVARAMVSRGYQLGQHGGAEQAIALYDRVQERFGDAPEAKVREFVATALFNKATTLRRLGRSDEANAAFDRLEERFGDAPEPAIHKLMTGVRRARAD